MSQFDSGFISYSEPYYTKPHGGQFDPGSEDPGSIEIPQSDFEPYYSELASYDSEIDNNFMNIQELGVPQGMMGDTNYSFQPSRAASHVALDSNTGTPPIQFKDRLEMDSTANLAPPFDEIPSSPPSSPPRSAPVSMPHLDPLGIRHPFGHSPRASISRIIDSIPVSSSPSTPFTPEVSNKALQSPFMMPPLPQQPISPSSNVFPTRQPLLGDNGSLPYPQMPHLNSRKNMMPDLSPALSDASSISPDPQSPDHDGFSWQPIVTIPRSEFTETIIEQQRKPRQKRKSCLPDGVVEEYVGTTDVDGVYICLYPNCQRLFRRTYNLRSHIQTHLCDRPYVCRVCDANFVRPHDLRRHERCHSNTKPYMCPCGKGFSRQDAMQRHRMREICEGAIASGVPKSPKPRGRPKLKKNVTISHSPELKTSPNLQPSALDHNSQELSLR